MLTPSLRGGSIPVFPPLSWHTSGKKKIQGCFPPPLRFTQGRVSMTPLLINRLQTLREMQARDYCVVAGF
jgi:hypothetical protein